MARPENGWGGPSYSQDIADNYMNTHHADENGVMIANDEEYLNSRYEDNLSVSDDVVRFSYHYLNQDYFADEKEDYFYDENELENFFDDVSLDDDWEY